MKARKNIGNYLLYEKIGSGCFAEVYRAIKNTDSNSPNPKQFAVKCIPKSKIESIPSLLKCHRNEINIMHQINHPHLLHLYDYYQTKNNFYLVLDYCEGGDLESYLQKNHVRYLKEKEALDVIYGVLKGFKKLRTFNIIHKDLKLSNLFLRNKKIVIGDFGLSSIGKEMNNETMGTALNMAPELFEDNC